MASAVDEITALLNEPAADSSGAGAEASTAAAKSTHTRRAAGKSPPAASKAAPAPDALEELDALTGGTPEPAVPAAVEEPGTLRALAEKLGVDPADLYKIKIPLGGTADDALTLGELKDIAKGRNDIEASKLAFDEAVATTRSQVAKDREDLTRLIGMLPKGVLTPEMVNRARAAGEEWQQQQGALLNDLVPEWRDEKVYREERAGMVTFAGKYGFEAHEIEQLADARLLAFVRTMMKREVRVAEVLARLKSSGAPSRGFKQNETARSRVAEGVRHAAASTGTRADKIGAIESILKGAKIT